MYIEDANSVALIKLNKELIKVKHSKEYTLGKKINICLELIKKAKFNELFGLFFLSLKGDNTKKQGGDVLEEPVFYQNYKGRIAVYTCIVGVNEKIPNPLFVSESCDYFVFTDNESVQNSVWKKIDIKKMHFPCENANEINRYIKLHPHELFPDYEYSMYVDGNICIVSDVVPIINQMKKEEFLALHKHDRRTCAYKEAEAFYHIPRLKKFAKQAELQMKEYRKQGFPKEFGLFENPIIIRRHHDKECINLMELWWEQLVVFSMRDQISLPYAIWKLGISNSSIHILGKDVRSNPRFIQIEHE